MRKCRVFGAECSSLVWMMWPQYPVTKQTWHFSRTPRGGVPFGPLCGLASGRTITVEYAIIATVSWDWEPKNAPLRPGDWFRPPVRWKKPKVSDRIRKLNGA